MITNYASLQSTVMDWLDWPDLENAVPTFIQMAEAKFRRDARCRKLQDRGMFLISADGAQLPPDLQSLEAWWHDGPTYYGPIEIVGADQIGALKARYGPSGPPAYAALVDGTAVFAPAPDGSYTTRMTYWRTITPLSDENTTNWLLESHPDVYLYGSLVESAPYLKDDGRIETWGVLLERALNELHRSTWDRQFSGTMRRQVRPIGG